MIMPGARVWSRLGEAGSSTLTLTYLPSARPFGRGDAHSVPTRRQLSSISEQGNVTVFADASPWRARTFPMVEQLRDLPVNWDSYGSHKIQQPAIVTALWLLSVVETEAPPLPQISPVPGGGIQLEWHTPTRELEMEAHPNGTISYVAVDEHEEMTEGDLERGQADDMQLLIRWLMGRADMFIA